MNTRDFWATVLLLAATLPLNAAESIPPPAWQRGDESLERKWEQLTGRFIYQQACTACHRWGPAHWARGRWEDYLKEFPGNHQPDARHYYKDLTAMFDVGKSVPTLKQEESALTHFILAAASPSEVAAEEREKSFESFPAVGSKAPHFTITDVNGAAFSLSRLADKKALVLVFSRAHW